MVDELVGFLLVAGVVGLIYAWIGVKLASRFGCLIIVVAFDCGW